MRRAAVVIAGIGGLLLCPHATFAAFVAPDLGDAATFTLLAIPNGSDAPSVNVSSDSDVTGTIGVGPGGAYHKSGSGDVIGSVLLSLGVSVLNTGSGSPGTIVPNSDLSLAIADAVAASTDATTLLPSTATFASITNSQTITGAGGVSVFAVGDLNLGGSDVLTLSGNATEFFVFNITGTLNLSGSSRIVTSGGLLPHNILFNVPTAGSLVVISASSEAVGTFLAPHRDFTLHGALVQGRIIANDIEVTSGGEFFALPPQPEPLEEPIIPEPATGLLVGLGALGGVVRPRRARS